MEFSVLHEYFRWYPNNYQLTFKLLDVEIKTFRYNYPQTKFEHILKLEYRKTKYPHVVMFMRTEDVYTFDSYFKYNYEKEQYDQVPSTKR